MTVTALFLCSVWCSPARADDETDRAVREIFSTNLYELTQPVYVYNWHNAVATKLPSSLRDPKSVATVRRILNSYWENRRNPRQLVDYVGVALYTAADPVVTNSYGGKDSRWVVTEVRLPAGTRLLRSRGPVTLSIQQKAAVVKLGCSKEWLRGSTYLLDILRPGLNSPACEAALRKILAEDLRVDGLWYNFSSAPLTACDPSNHAHEAAIALFSGERLGSDDIAVFSEKTRDGDESRLRIRSIANMAIPSVMATAKDLAKFKKRFAAWKDLAAVPDDATVSAWVQKSLLGCSGTTQWKRVGTEDAGSIPGTGDTESAQ